MMRNTNYLKRYSEITTQLASENEVSKEDVEFIIDQFFFNLKGFIIDPRLPTIKITNLGTFKPTIGKMDWHINNCLDKLEKKIGDPEKLQKRIDYLEPIRDRLIREKSGESTWKEWRDKYKNNDKQKSKSKKQKFEGEGPKRHNNSNREGNSTQIPIHGVSPYGAEQKRVHRNSKGNVHK